MGLLSIIRRFGDRASRLYGQGKKFYFGGAYTKAAIAWKKAAGLGHLEAAERLGEMFVEGTGVLRSLADAKHWYGIAAEGGITRAQARLAELCLIGGGPSTTGLAPEAIAALCPNGATIERDELAARKWALAAAQQGDTAGQALIGYLLASGRGGPIDHGQAAHWYRLAAEEGVQTAQLGLGILLAGSFIGEPEYAAAMSWFERAAEQGNGTALYYIGVLHQKGLGVEPDGVRAFVYFKRSAATGCVEGQRMLGQALLSGTGCAPDRTAAEAWLRKAARSGDVEAMIALGDLFAKETAGLAEALNWYHSAANHGHKGAQLMVQRIHERQQGVWSEPARSDPPQDETPRPQAGSAR